MKKLFIFLILFSAILLYCDETNCFSIIVGSKATEDGSVLLAHNEDDKGKNFFVNVHRISPLNHSSPTVIKLKNNATISQINQTFGFLWLQIPDIEFADSYINENGVVIVSNACESREDKPDLTNGGIGFMLRRIVAERATSARHAIEIAGSLIERFGYYSSGRTLCIADSTEGWILHIVKGKHWIARRVPDNEVAVVSNYYTIRNFNMKNRKDFLGSPDIVYYATKRGWYDPRKDGDFDFAKVYSDLKNFKSMVNILRQWRGSNLLSEDKYKIDSRFPFSFKPKKKIKIGNLFRVLRDHYEGTEYDLTDNYKKGGSPNSTKNRTICTKSTRFSFVAQLRNEEPEEIANIIWIAFRRPDSNAYAPWYLSISSPPEGYTRGNSASALDKHFNKPQSYFKFNSTYAYWTYSKLSELVDKDYRNRIKKVRKQWNNFENYAIKSLKKKEKEFRYLLKKDKNIAVKIITNYVHNLEYRKWFLATDLINKMR